MDLRPNLVSNWRKKNRRKREGRGKERRRGRGREEEEKRGRDKKKPRSKRYGTTWAFKVLNGFPCNCMVINCLQPRVLLGFHPNPIIIESKVDKTINSTRSI